jgi:ribonuclease E
MTLQTIIALLFLLLPLIASLLEQKKRKEKADEAMEEIERRQSRPRGSASAPPASAPERPAASQTLAEWIEEVRQRGEQSPDAPSPPPNPRGGRSVFAERDLIETIEEDEEPRRRTRGRTSNHDQLQEAEEVVSAAREAAQADATLEVDAIKSRAREEVAGSAYARRARPTESADRSADNRDGEDDAAPGARRARRARREGDSTRGYRLSLGREDLARALILREVLGPPLALRDEED